jgi:uncharacterized protein DUF1153
MQEKPHTTGLAGLPRGGSESGGRGFAAERAHALLSELPPPNTQRWVIRRKAVVVAAVRSGVLTLEEACERYKLSIEEFLSWQRLIDSHGMAGLRVTRLQDYRNAPRPR